MSQEHLKTEERRPEPDLLKALAIISMIFCHPVIRLGIHHAG